MNHEAIIVKTTNGVAAAGVLMPAWLPTLAEANQAVSLGVACLSAIWLVVQIRSHIRKDRRK